MCRKGIEHIKVTLQSYLGIQKTWGAFKKWDFLKGHIGQHRISDQRDKIALKRKLWS